MNVFHPPVLMHVMLQESLNLGADYRDKQEGNSNLDCVPRTAVVAMCDGGRGGGS